VHIPQDGLLYDAERDRLAIATSLVYISFGIFLHFAIFSSLCSLLIFISE